MTSKPTPIQADVLRYYAGLRTKEDHKRPSWANSERACERRGWIEPIDEFPYTRTTDAGRKALDQI